MKQRQRTPILHIGSTGVELPNITPLVRCQGFLDISADINRVRRVLVASELHLLITYFGSSYNMHAEVIWHSMCWSGWLPNQICVSVRSVWSVELHLSKVEAGQQKLFFFKSTSLLLFVLNKASILTLYLRRWKKHEIVCNLPVTKILKTNTSVHRNVCQWKVSQIQPNQNDTAVSTL